MKLPTNIYSIRNKIRNKSSSQLYKLFAFKDKAIRISYPKAERNE
jgi:hypothetical protein